MLQPPFLRQVIMISRIACSVANGTGILLATFGFLEWFCRFLCRDANVLVVSFATCPLLEWIVVNVGNFQQDRCFFNRKTVIFVGNF